MATPGSSFTPTPLAHEVNLEVRQHPRANVLQWCPATFNFPNRGRKCNRVKRVVSARKTAARLLNVPRQTVSNEIYHFKEFAMMVDVQGVVGDGLRRNLCVAKHVWFFGEVGIKINQKVYRRDIIEALVLPWDQKQFRNSNWTLQQDSATVCKAKKAQKWCKANCPDMISSEE
ncbi:uncharacterized protein TNCV_2278291 [Trichonephila clavipes]|nr:uncharacterized protein TNCV_2278291 [Trichonephila clavipes]